MKVRAQAEKKFRRANAKPVRRRAVRRWITWRLVRAAVCTVLATYAGYRAIDLVVTASTLQVQRVAIHGNVRLSVDEIHGLIDGLAGSSIVTADLATYRRRLLDSPWVADVALRRVLPSTIEVFVSERRPIGLSRRGGRLYLVDATGTVIDEFGPEYADFDLPIIDGLLEGSDADAAQRASLAARFIETLSQRKELARRVSQIDVSNARNAVVLLADDPALLHVGDEQFAERLQYYLELAPALRQNVREMDYVDLRFGQRVYVRPAGSAGRKKF